MKKINYEMTVNINQGTMKLGFRCMLPKEREGQKIRVLAVFTQKKVERRIPMAVSFENLENGKQVLADAEILLPYVFYSPPRRDVSVLFSLWCGTEEALLDTKPFPVKKEQFARTDVVYKRNIFKFFACTLALPYLLLRNYFREDRNLVRAAKSANASVYRMSGYSYSGRQQKTDYFAVCYRKYAQKEAVHPKRILFLSEREPEEGGNLLLVKKWFLENTDAEITEFINTRTIDHLRNGEIRDCARKCATASVIILEDFYPQLHSIRKRGETKIVQLWHACGAFKTFGLTRAGQPGSVPQTSMNHRNYDFVSVSSETVRSIYAEAFGISLGKVKAFGVPRTDCLFDWRYKRRKREELYVKYPAFRESRVILFAPTFRGAGNRDAYYPKEAFPVDAFMASLPEDTVLVLKNHPFVREALPVGAPWSERVLDLSGEENINDLMLVSSLLITDYSSSVFEAALLELPMLFYAFDQEAYMASRDFYFDYEAFTPGAVTSDFSALCEKTAAVLDGHEETEKDLAAFRRTFLDAVRGGSTERICAYIQENYLR